MAQHTGEFKPRVISIVVSGGTGSTTAQIGGIVILTAIKAPVSTDVYTLEILDRDTTNGPFGMFGLTAQGSQSISKRYQLDPADGQTFSMTDANDGTYKIKLWFDAYNK